MGAKDKLKEDEVEFVRVCEGRMKETDGKLKLVDVNKVEKEVEVKSLATLHDVIKELVAALPDGVAAKKECDKVIDKNGPAKTGGTGIKQLRENIAGSKLSYEIMDDAAQVFLKSKIMDNIHKYFYMIAFTAYLRRAAELARNSVSDEDK